MRIVVTGGAGFIGSNIIAQLEARGLGPIAVIDELAGEQWLNIAKRMLHDIVAPRETWAYLDGCPNETAVVHMGARSSTADDDAEALIETNAMLTVRLFVRCAERGWPFIYASSAAVYGADPNQSDDNDRQLHPLNAYAWSKMVADLMVIARAADKAPPRWAALRFFNVYGPNESHKGQQRSFISQCFDAIRLGQTITLFRGSEMFRRDFVYVEDCARLVADLIDPIDGPKAPVGGMFNVGTGVATSFTEVAAACIGAAGRVTPVATTAFPDALYGRYQTHTRAETAKLMQVLPEFRFADLQHGVSHYWKTYASRDGMSRFP